MVGDGGLAYSSSVLGCRVRTYPLRRGGDSPWHKMREESAEGGTKFCFLTYNSHDKAVQYSFTKKYKLHRDKDVLYFRYEIPVLCPKSCIFVMMLRILCLHFLVSK